MNQRINWGYIGSVVLNIILFMFLLRCCSLNPCGQETIKEVVRIDTIRIPEEKIIPVVVAHKPQPRKIAAPAVASVMTSPSSASPADGVHVSSAGAANVFSCLSDTAFYSDTVRQPDNFLAIIADTLMDNRIQGRSIWFKNLSPQVQTTITKTVLQKERVRLYAGLFAGASVNYTTRQFSNWAVGPELLLTIPQGTAIGYSFDAKSNGHLLHVLQKIKLKK